MKSTINVIKRSHPIHDFQNLRVDAVVTRNWYTERCSCPYQEEIMQAHHTSPVQRSGAPRRAFPTSKETVFHIKMRKSSKSPVHYVQGLPLGVLVAEPIGVALQGACHLAPLAAERGPHPHLRKHKRFALQRTK